MANFQNLREFLVLAKKSTYASGSESIKNKDKNDSTSLVFQDGDFLYHDNYFGGEPYGGREVVFYKGEPLYIMVYYGSVDQDFNNINEIYKVLQKALLLIPKEYPYRGPSEYIEGNYRYVNEYIGEIDNFSGREFIEYDKKIVYEAKYIGGLVDQR
jgi:hypothetical protein